MSLKGRAAVFVTPNMPFELRAYPVPVPRPGEVLLQVVQANVSGSDRHLWSGHTDVRQLGVRHPVILGREMIGRVVDIGEGRDKDAAGRELNPGDRVTVAYHNYCGSCRACERGRHEHCPYALHTPLSNCDQAPHFFGAFAEYYLVREHQALYSVPEDMSDALASLANCAMAQALHGLEVAQLQTGDAVVVLGCGALGLLTCALARHMGATTVIAVDVDPFRLDYARRMGATHVIDGRKSPDPKVQVGVVRQLTGGWGADAVIEVAGVADVLTEGVRMLGRGGRLVTIGAINPRAYWRADASQFVLFNRSIIGLSLYPQEVLGRALHTLAVLETTYSVSSLITHEYSLTQLTDAMREPPMSMVRASVHPGRTA